MKNDIYIMLNDADINLEDYKKEDFNDIEKKNIKTNFRKSISFNTLCSKISRAKWRNGWRK